MRDSAPKSPRWAFQWPKIVHDLANLLSHIEQPVYIVGGAVRDMYLRRPIKDIDLAVQYDSIKLARFITNRLEGNIFVMDTERGVARVQVNAPNGTISIDVAQFRGPDLNADLRDRDFTINAMAVDVRNPNQIIDPLNGTEDIITKRLRRCTPNAIGDDPIRGLRGIRQSVQFGMQIEAETLRDIRTSASHIPQSSPERVRDELFRLLALDNPAVALRIADNVGILEQILPEIVTLKNLSHIMPHRFDVWHHTLVVIEKLANIISVIGPTRTDNTAARFELGMMAMQLDRFRNQLRNHLFLSGPNDRQHKALLILAAILHNAGKSTENAPNYENHIERGLLQAELCAERLHLSNGEKQCISTVIRHYRHFLTLSDLDPLKIHRFWYPLNESGVDVILFGLADYLGMVGIYLEQDVWLKHIEKARMLLFAFFEQYDLLVKPLMLVNGNHLMEILELPAGAQIGRLLVIIREAQVMGLIHTFDEAIALARQQITI